jgi:bifunctional pyridoxal-dependent enzyme with beta-cystathionase and maltose regulon repressor activities
VACRSDVAAGRESAAGGEWAKVVLSDGAEFCQGTEVDTLTFVRLNFATSTDDLLRILDRISALDRD